MEPKYEDQTDDGHAICPYCLYKNHVESEDYSEDEREEECSSCGKYFWLHEHFSVSHDTYPDCSLNGEEHKFELVNRKSGRQVYFCSICNVMKVQL